MSGAFVDLASLESSDVSGPDVPEDTDSSPGQEAFVEPVVLMNAVDFPHCPFLHNYKGQRYSILFNGEDTHASTTEAGGYSKCGSMTSSQLLSLMRQNARTHELDAWIGTIDVRESIVMEPQRRVRHGGRVERSKKHSVRLLSTCDGEVPRLTC